MKIILTINAGSSSIKFALYQFIIKTTLGVQGKEGVSVVNPTCAPMRRSTTTCCEDNGLVLYEKEGCRLLYNGSINNLLEAPIFKVRDDKHQSVIEKSLPGTGHISALEALVQWIGVNAKGIKISAIGHRVVHGGKSYSQPVIITPEIVTELEKLIPLAPLHQPYNVEAIKIMMALFPSAPQIACFDTAFHSTGNHLARLYAMPRKYMEEGIIRYGFHGLSYEYIASMLPEFAGEKADSKVIVAHLGNGSSMCAMYKRKSVATTMGFTALEGLVMGTRAGSIDPGIILYLQQHHKLSVGEVEHLLYKESGLLGVSGISHDVEVLQKSDSPNAKEALDLFCYRASQELAKLVSSLQGIDVLVFTAGIGENSILIRRQICELTAWLGIKIDEDANALHKPQISLPTSPVAVYVIPTNEELMIAKYVLNLL